jgi:hypothetical protein
MKKNKTAYAIEKIKATDNSVNGFARKENHMNRTESPIPLNVEPSLSVNNRVIIPLDSKYSSFSDAFKKITSNCISHGTMKSIRKDAVLGVSIVATYTNVIFLDDGTRDYNADDLNHWIYDTILFTQETFGKSNILSAVLHLDEPGSGPHLHIVLIPIDKDHRLCYKNFINGPKELRNLQNNYFEDVGKKYHMERGNKYHTYRKEGSKYKNISEFRAATIGKSVVDAEEIAAPRDNELRDNGDIIPEEYIPRLTQEIRQANFSHQKELAELRDEVGSQESDLIKHYMERKKKLADEAAQEKEKYRRQMEEKEREIDEEKKKLKEKQDELERELKAIKDFMKITKGSILHGENSIEEIQKAIHTYEEIKLGLEVYPESEREAARKTLNDVLHRGSKEYHRRTDNDIKIINDIMQER